MRFRVLGTLQVSLADGRDAALGGFRQRMVLAVLLLHAGETVSLDALIGGVWGDAPPPTARKTLQVYVSRLRRALEPGDLQAVPGGYTLHADPTEIDAVRFERAAAAGRGLLEHAPDRAATVLREALALWRGVPWGELGDQDALRSDAERLRELRLVVVEDRLTADLAAGRVEPVTGELSALVSDHPTRERLRGLLMLALYREDRLGEALQVFEEGRRWLADELGTDPGARLQALHRRMLDQDPTLLAAPRAEPVDVHRPDPPNPYKGLEPFTESDAARFFGRDALVGDLLERVDTSPFVVVVGPSGSGKSSVVRAGVVPALSGIDGEDAWRIVLMRPGADPVGQLERALARSRPAGADEPAPPRRDDGLDLLRATGRAAGAGDRRLLVIVDQFEELFLQAGQLDRERFIRDLAEAVEDPSSGLTVIAVLRADLLSQPMAHPRLGPLVTQEVVPVLPLTPSELEAACVRPPARVGVTVEPELAAELIAEVAGRPGALPLFQFTMTELFDRRAGSSITLADHRSIGGVSGVVARRAEETFADLDAASKDACRQLFLRLVALGEEGEIGRRRAARTSLDIPLADVVLGRFGSARLLAFDHDSTTNEPTVEVAHEAVFRAWPRLHGWIEAAQDDLRMQRSVALAAAEWIAAGRAEGYLLTGTRLDLALAWRERADIAPTSTEREYLDASEVTRDDEVAAERARHRRELVLERRATGRLRALVAVLAVAALVAGSLGAVAVSQRTRAEQRAAEARAAAQIDRARQLASTAIANRVIDPERSLLLALHATNIVASAELQVPRDIVDALHWSLQAARVTFPSDAPAVAVTGPSGPQGIFELPIEDLVALARDNVTRQLTSDECAEYLASGTCPALPAVLPDVVGEDAVVTDAARPDQPLAGTRVSLVHTFSGTTMDGLQAALETITERTGIEVEQTSPADLVGVVRRGLEAQTPPDIAVVPWPIAIPTNVRDGELIDLSTYLDEEELRHTLSPHLVSLGSVADDGTWPAEAGPVYGIPVRVANKSTIWYSIPGFAEHGYSIPTNLDALEDLTEQVVADGSTPWCHGEGSGDGSGWPGTDLVENLLLQTSQESYDAWVRHEIGFDSPPLRDAFERMGRLLLRPGHVVGGPASAVIREYDVAAVPLFDDPPGCLLYAQGNFASVWFPLGTELGRDVGVFPFPSATPGEAARVLGAADFAGAFTDRPEVREVLRQLGTVEFGQVWARHDPSFLSPRTDFPIDAYVTCGGAEDDTCGLDPVRAALAPPLQDALRDDRYRFDGSDLLSHEVGLEPMWQAMLEFVGTGPGEIDRILADLEATWVERERAAGDWPSPAA